MKCQLEISIAALLDIEQAIEWYEDQSEGLGNRLKENLFESLSIVEQIPLLSSQRYRDKS